MWPGISLVLGAYLLGSVPHLALLARLHHISLDGDFHMSMWQKAKRLTAVVGILGEFAKGVIPVLVGKSLGFSLSVTAIAGLAAVSGQMWPVFSRFDGEKGNSIGLAMAMALTPLSTLVALVPIIVALVVRTVSRMTGAGKSPGSRSIIGGAPSYSLPLGMAAGFLTLPFAAWRLGEPPVIVWTCLTLFVVIMVRRLTAGIRRDLAANSDVSSVLMMRLLYDRPAVGWRGGNYQND